MKIIILDRDGVINLDSSKFIKSPEEWIAIDGSLKAIANLVQLGYAVVVCTNQSGIGRGLFSIEELNQIHEKMHRLVSQSGGEIVAIFVCPHVEDDNCRCRKPKPGMIYEICNRFNIEQISTVMLVGDSERDLQAIYMSGGIPVLVKTGNGKKTLKNKSKLPANTLVFDNLLEFSEYLAGKEESPPYGYS